MSRRRMQKPQGALQWSGFILAIGFWTLIAVLIVALICGAFRSLLKFFTCVMGGDC